MSDGDHRKAGTAAFFRAAGGFRWLAVAAAFAMSGCGMFRAQMGVGIGLGFDVRVPGALHTGLEIGEFQNIGWHYDRGPDARREFAAALLVWHYEGARGVLTSEEQRDIAEKRATPDDAARMKRRLRNEHQCIFILPPLTTFDSDYGGEHLDPWSLEVGVMLLFFDFHLGFNPLGRLP